MSQFPTFKNPNTTPIAEITYEIPQGEYDGKHGFLDLIINPVITIKYANGEQTVYDTNLIYKRGFEQGMKKANDSIKKKLGLK